MQNAPPLHKLLIAASNLSLSFNHFPLNPIKISSTHNIKLPTNVQIIERYNRHGFAIVEFESKKLSSDTVITLGQSLELGEPFTPPLYSKGNYKTVGISKISVQPETDKAYHPSFQRTKGVNLHADGTLQKIGEIKTTIMLCETPGAEGGDTILFNSSAAFAELLLNDRAAALALTHPEVFVRQANINGCNDINKGPAFSVENGQLISAYSITETDSFKIPKGVHKNDLVRAIDFFQNAARTGSPYFAQIKLGKGQGIILANARIAHGRTEYKNAKEESRCLYRALYIKHPSLNATCLAELG